MNQQSCSPFELLLSQGSFLTSEDQDEVIVFPGLPDSSNYYQYVDASLVARDNQKRQLYRRPSLVTKTQFSWMSFFKELFVSRTVFDLADDDEMCLEDMTISWSASDEDSDISSCPGLEDWGTSFDEDPSEEDTFCIETVLRRSPRPDLASETESILVTWSALE